jgi:hypothetical protein
MKNVIKVGFVKFVDLVAIPVSRNILVLRIFKGR